MTEKDQSKINNESLPELKASAPTSDTPYIEPIIGKLGYDTRPEYKGLFGLGTSKDNGVNFHVFLSLDGLVFDDSDMDNIWNGTKDQVAKVVAPAKSAADSAASAADAAVENSRVNSQAIVDINSAVSDAVSDADVARKDSLRAWNAAQSNVDLIDLNYASASAEISSARTEAIAAADEAKKSANAAQADIVAVRSDVAVVQSDVKSTKSDVAMAKSDIADTKANLTTQAKNLSSYAAQASAEYENAANALSNAKTELDSDVAVAKSLANTAQTTADSAVQSASENARALASQANALSDTRKAMDSGVASAMGLANAAQTTADNAVKSAASVASDLTAVASQASANSSGITKVTSDVGLLQTTVADNSGNISKIQETATKIQQAVSDNSGAIMTATQTADSAVAVASDAKSNATVAVQTASGASVTAKNAQSDATTAMVTASGAVTQASDAKSNATIAVQTASEASVTATNAQGDASIAKQTASDASIQIKNAQGDISSLQTRAGKIEASVATNSGAIANVQATANQLKASVSDNSGKITTAKQTADSAVTVASDAKSNATVAIQTASQASITAKNASGQAASAVLTANGAVTTASDAKSNATVAIQTASGASQTATNAQSDATIAKQTASEAIVQASNANSDFSRLSIRANKIEENVATNSGAIASVQQTANGLTTTVADIKANGGGRNLLVGTSTASGDVAVGNGNYIKGAFNGYDAVKTNGAWSERCINLQSALGRTDAKVGDWYTISVYVKADKQIDTGSLIPCRALGNGDANTNDGFLAGISMQDKPITTQWKQYSWSFQINNISLQRQITRIEYNQDTGDNWIYWGGWMLEEGIVAHDWSPAPEDTDAKITANSTAIDQNRKAITLKADQTTVDKANGDVQKLQSQLKIQAGQIDSKVSSSDLNAKGYATQSYTQTQIKQTTDSWNANLTSVKDGLTQSYTNLHATVDGIQTQVYNKDGSSRIDQLAGMISTKVSQGDYNSQIAQFKNDINLRVAKGDVISQINQEAGGDTLIQVSNGKKSLILDAGNTVFTGKAWIPVAAIANLTADQVQAGTLSGSKVHAGDNSGNGIDMGVIGTNYVGFHSYATNGDNTYIDYNGIHNYGANYDTRIQQGKVTTNYIAVNGGGTIDFRDSNGTGMTANGSTLAFNVGNSPAGYLSYNGMPVADIPDGSGGNELQIRYGLSAAIIPNDNSGARATFSGVAQKIGYMTGTNQGKKMLSGLEVDSNNHLWIGTVNSDATWNRLEINDWAGLNIAYHDNTHFWVSDGRAKLYKDTDDGQTATELEVHGWAWVNGWVEAAGHSQHSTLSSKTRIEEADPDYMLDLVNNTDLTTFAFKSEVAEGIDVRHIGPIIDDVHDVAQYRIPTEFIAPTKKARDDDNMIGALFGAVQSLTKRIKALEENAK